MNTEPLQAGSSVESACRKCKTVTDHHVVVMIDGKVGKVQCKICGGKHVHRPPQENQQAPEVSPPKATAKGKAQKTLAAKKPVAPKKPNPEIVAFWQAKITTAGPEQFLPYVMTGAFQDGDVISHATFGPGYVQRFIKPNMIEVLFEDGVKLLRCCAAPATA